MLVPVKYEAGTNKARQHTRITSPAFTDTDHVRFQSDGRLATIPPYALSSNTGVKGKCRSIYAQRLTGDNEGNYYFFGTHSYLYVEFNGNLYNITPIESGAGVTLGTDPLNITSGSTTVIITETAHGKPDGYRIAMSGIGSDLSGIPQADFNREFIITYIDADHYSVEVQTAASSTDTTAGGTGIVIKSQITEGNATQESAEGMGAGYFGAGLFGAGGVSSSGVMVYPRIWSFDAFGNEVVMCPGDYGTGDGQKIYIWDGDLDVAPSALTNAPTDCNWVCVVNNSVVALCGRTVKISKLGDGTVWSGLSYREKTLERIDLAHSAWRHGEKDAVIHYGNGAILLRYTGDADLWDLSDLYEDDGVVSPMSCVRLGSALFWRGKHGKYYYDGGVVQRIENTQNGEWILANAVNHKEWHSFAVADQQKGEIYFYFTTGTDTEPSDYVLLNPTQGSFTLGMMTRTAAQRPTIINETLYMANSGDSTTNVYKHFTQGATTFNWYAETSFFFSNNGETRIFLDEFRPDSNQSGDITLQIIGRMYPQSADEDHGTYTISPSTEFITVKAAANYLKIRFSGSSEMTLGNWTYNVRNMGRR